MLLNRKFRNIIDQLAHFSKIGTNKDDDIDSLEMAVSRLKSFVEEDSGYDNDYTPSEVISRFDGI